MAGNRYTAEDRETENRDTRLAALLKQWPALEPRANFEQRVWQRIHAHARAEAERFSLARIFRERLLPHPIGLSAVAAALAILLSMGAGLLAPDRHPHPAAETVLFHSPTLTESYVALTRGSLR